MNEQIFNTNSLKQTQTIAKNLGKSLKSGTIIALYGELGNGKTTFVQGLAKGLGIKKRIISPTFIIIRKYRIRNQELGIKNFYHIDLYRIDSKSGLESLGLKEIISNPDNIVAVEWAEKLGNLLPKNRIDVKLDYLGDNKRKITIKNLYE